jgi:type I restriction enzyme S subunit
MTPPLTRIRDLAEQIRGVSYEKDDAADAPRFGYVPVLRAGNITEDGLAFDDLVFVPHERVSEKQKIRRHDVVLAASSGSLDIVGKAAQALHDFNGGFGAFCKVLRPNSKVHPGYFAQFFKTPEYRQRVSALAAGANINNLRNEHLDDMEIPFPPLAEQQRIAEILDQAEALRARRRAGLAQLEVLTHAFFLELFGHPVWNTRGLPLITVGQLGDWKSGGTPPRGREEYFEGSIPWFSSGELNQMVVTESNEHISELALRETSAKSVPQGALMLGMYDTAALKASIAGVPCACNQAIAFAEIDKRVAETIFLYYAIVIGREHFRRLQRGVRQKNLNLSMIRELRIPLPSLSLQRAFVTSIASAQKLKAMQLASLAEMNGLFASLQQAAFRGQL